MKWNKKDDNLISWNGTVHDKSFKHSCVFHTYLDLYIIYYHIVHIIMSCEYINTIRRLI